MKKIKRILSLMLSVALVLGIVLIPDAGTANATTASAQSSSDQTIHPFKGTDALIQDTIEELFALGETAEETEENKALAAKVEKASDLTYDQARSLVYGALTADFDASRIDVSQLGLSEKVMSELMESILADHYLSGAFTNLTYETKNGKVTAVNYTVSEGFASAMTGYSNEILEADLSQVDPDVGTAAAQAAEEAEAEEERPVRSPVSTFSLTAQSDEETTGCQNHTVGAMDRGDYNKDGKITNEDVIAFRQLVAAGTAKDGDYNEDGSVDVADIQKFANMVAAGELEVIPAGVTFTWNQEPVQDTSYAYDENNEPIIDEATGMPVGFGLLYDHASGQVSTGVLPDIHYVLESVSFYCSECGQQIVIDRSTEEGAAALDRMIQAQDIYINMASPDMSKPETKAVEAGTDPGFTDEEKEYWLLYTEMEVAFYTDDTFSVGPVMGPDGSPILGEDGNPVYAPATDADGNPIGLYATGENDSMDNGAAEVNYYYGILSSFINDKADYFGTPTDFWTSKNSEGNPMAALKYVCNVDPETPVPPAQMTMMVRDLPQAFMSYFYQYGNELVAMRNAAIAAMPEGLTYVQQLLFLHDWLAENAWFDMGAMTAKDEDGNPASSDPIQMTTFGALLSNQLRDSYNGGYYGSLCPGYAAAYNLLVQAANPDIYQTTEKDENGDETTRWATVAEVDERGGDLVDFVQVLFYTNTAETSIAGEGFGGGWFNNVHYFSAVKAPSESGEGADAEGNAWYYVDACYDDIYIECLQQYRGESDGSVNHTYFMLSPQTMATLYGDDVERIDSLYDGYVYVETDEVYKEGDEKYNPDDPEHHKYRKDDVSADETAEDYEFMYDDTGYEDSWFSGAISKIYWGNDGYVYYVDGGASAATYADLLAQLEDMQGSQDSEGMSMDSMMHGSRVDVEGQDLLKKRPYGDKETGPDYWEDEENSGSGTGMGDMFSSKEDTYAEVLLDYGTGAMNGEVVQDGVIDLGQAVIEDFVFNEQYPALTHTVALYGGKLYFNLSNDIYVCDPDGSNVKLFKEYNQVNATSDGRIFTATSYTLNENGTDLSVTNHPIGAIGVHTTYTPQYMDVDYGGQTVQVFTGMDTAETMTVNIATNYSFTSAGLNDDGKYVEEERYTVEAVNFNPDYQLFSKSEKDPDENDNAEFMWCAVIRDELDIANLVNETGGSEVKVPATCTRPAYTDVRTENGVILSRTAVEGSEPTGHNYVYNEAEGVYLCADCQLHANVKVENTVNGTVTLYAISSNGMEGFEGGTYGEDIIPVSTVREAETKDTGEIEIICQPEEGYRVAKVEYISATAAEGTEYTEIPATVNAETGEKQYLLEKDSGCISIRVTFADATTVTVAETKNGTVTLAGLTPTEEGSIYNVDPGTEVTVNAAAGDGYQVDTVQVTGANGETIEVVPVEGKEGVYTFTMPETNVTVSATFVEKAYTVTVTAGENGSASANPVSGVAGTEVTITATPDEGYEVDQMTVEDAEGKSVTVENGKFTMPDADVAVTVTFKKTEVTPDPDTPDPDTPDPET